MANDYYNPSGTPGTRAFAASAPVRSEYASVAAGFAKLPALGAPVVNNIVVVKADGSGITSAAPSTLTVGFATAAAVADLATNATHATTADSATSATTAGAVTGLSVTTGKTITVTNSFTLGGTDGAVITLPPVTASLGYLGIPVTAKSADYTLALADQGTCIYHPTTDASTRTWTIPANASVAFPVNSVVTFYNDIGGGVITIAITSDTLVLAGTGSTGSRTLAAGGLATMLKVTSTRWVISGGVGLT